MTRLYIIIKEDLIYHTYNYTYIVYATPDKQKAKEYLDFYNDTNENKTFRYVCMGMMVSNFEKVK